MGGGTYEQIEKMLELHYSGKINISDYWAVGDDRTEKMSAIAAGTTKEAQPEQYFELVILDFNHDILETPIQAKSYSAITVGTKNCLQTKGVIWDAGSEDKIKWRDSTRRTWCNNDFFNALPSKISKLIKPVNKKTSISSKRAIYDIQIETVDKIFILSTTEIDGAAASNDHSYYDGTQYEYMKTASNRIKSIGTTAVMWYLRTAWQRDLSDDYDWIFYRVLESGTVSNGIGTAQKEACGIAPAFCL